MSSFTEKLANFLAPIAEKFASQRHLSAIRDGFIVVMPLIIIASFFLLVNNVILDPENGIFGSVVDLSRLQDIGVTIFNSTLGIISILIAFTVSYNLAESREKDGLIPGVLGISLLFIFFPLTNSVIPVDAEEAVEIAGIFTQENTSATGLFMALIAALLGTEIYLKLLKFKSLNIKMPESVPPMVIKSFSSLLPALLTLSIFASAVFLLDLLFGYSFPELITSILQAPLKSIVTSFSGMLFITFIQNVLWGLGIHGANVTTPIIQPSLLTAIQENMQAFEAGIQAPNIITWPFVDVFTLLGGGGCILALIIAIFIVSKRKEYKQISKIGLVPSLFNIAEPMMFGIPVVMNPVLIIPLIIAPAVNFTIAFIATSLEWIDRTVVMVPWTTPPVIAGYLATGGDWRAAVLSVILIGINVLVYMPFVMALNKVSLK